MWGFSCLLQEGIGEKTKQKRKEKAKNKNSTPVVEADANVKGC
jgi:hypothetical protein